MSRLVRVNIKGEVIEVPMTDDINTAINIFVSKKDSIIRGVTADSFSSFTFVRIARDQLQEMELIKLHEDRYYLAPQMYVASMKFNEIEKSPLAPIYKFFGHYLKASQWDFGYDFNAFSNSPYYTEQLFKEYFSPNFNEEMEKIGEGRKTTLEESEIIDGERKNDTFMHTINREMDSWRVQVFKK